MKNLIEELVKSGSNKALVLTIIGDEYRKKIDRIALPNFIHYCRAHDLGLLVLNDYVNSNDRDLHPYNLDPGYQRLKSPTLIRKYFPRYEFLCDLDADCIPSSMGRNIFSVSELKKGTINLVIPTPEKMSRQILGRKISLLRRCFHQPDFPLDSLLAGSDDDEKNLLGFDFNGPISTLGTCVGHIDDLAESGARLYELINSNFSGYLQNYRNAHYADNFNIHYLPYEFQAIWNFEIAQYYPFLYFLKDTELALECVNATMLRVDMLHFAGGWPENDAFQLGPFFMDGGCRDYYRQIPAYQAKEVIIKPYGRIKFNPSS